ncbi:MAG: hypothetical protein C4K58_07820 [Flavobacteriaceae bacterium]|nr:MAG: hypothetical protein C4K58_07820 [Flavobacteriaceae bacterium]
MSLLTFAQSGPFGGSTPGGGPNPRDVGVGTPLPIDMYDVVLLSVFFIASIYVAFRIRKATA